MPKFNDISGKKFNRLRVISFSHRSIGSVYYNCICDCGNKKTIQGSRLIGSKTKSCGCIKVERIIRDFTKHNKCHSKTYYIWAAMVQRCGNKNNKHYKYYGGRGIKVCKRWLDFSNFLLDMGEKPESMSIDRINNDKNYCKSNCRWTTAKKQNENKRNQNGFNFRKLTLIEVIEIENLYKNKKYSFSYLGKKFNVSRTSISNIINKKTWRKRSE